MADPTDFTDEENWHGGFYELAMNLGPRSAGDADDRLITALTAVWEDAGLNGCYLDGRTDRSQQTAVEAQLVPIDHPAPMYGVATLPGGSSTVCLTVVVREHDDEDGPGPDWLDLGLPLGGLGRIDEHVGGYPFELEGDSRSWREPIDDWLASIARRVHERAGIELGIIGFEVSGEDWTFTGGRPSSTYVSYLAPADGGLAHLKPAAWT